MKRKLKENGRKKTMMVSKYFKRRTDHEQKSKKGIKAIL